jgi:hypothetical protein
MSFRTFFSAVLLVAVSACSQRDKKARLAETAVVGIWRNDSLPSANADIRRYRLTMTADGMAEFVSEYVGKGITTERGTWDGADSLVRVVVRGEATGSRPTSILLAMRGDTLSLVQFDTTAWGRSGLSLRRR